MLMLREFRAITFIFSLPLFTAGAVHAGTVTIAGSGGMIPLLTILADSYMQKNPGHRIKVNQTSITQSGGVLATKSGAADIGMSARLVPWSELDASISAYHIANVPATVAVHNNVKVTNLSEQQLCDIYSGKITNWREVGGQNAPVIVLTRPNADSTKLAFREGISCFRELRETETAVQMFKSNDMLNALQCTPNAIGMIDLIALKQSKGKAHPVKLDGKTPSTAQVATGRWPIIKKYTLIIRKDREKEVDSFIRFIKSSAGNLLIKANGGVPLNFKYP